MNMMVPAHGFKLVEQAMTLMAMQTLDLDIVCPWTAMEIMWVSEHMSMVEEVRNEAAQLSTNLDTNQLGYQLSRQAGAHLVNPVVHRVVVLRVSRAGSHL